MGKQPEKTAPKPDELFAFGVDIDGKARGARFAVFNERALKFALDLGLVGVYPASPEVLVVFVEQWHEISSL